MLPLENITVGRLLQRTAQQYGEAPAIRYADTTIPYAQLLREVRRFAAIFAQLGVKKDCHVALWAEPEPEVLYAFYALQWIGAVAVMLNTSLGGEELAEALRISETHILCVGKSYRTQQCMEEKWAGVLDKTEVGALYTLGESAAGKANSLQNQPGADDASARENVQALANQVTPQDTAVILFTSGSTDYPKAVLSSHYARVNNGIQQAADLGASSADAFCVAMPLFHCFCISVNVMAALAVGGCLCLPHDRHTKSILSTMEQCRCTILSSVPTMYHAMLANPAFKPSRTASLRTGIIGGAYYPPEDFVQIEQAIGPQFTLLSSLGQTECTAGLTVCAQTDSLAVRSSTVGHFMNHVQGKIVDIHTGKTLPCGQKGEICVRGYLVMQGYFHHPELTARAIDPEGWLHTGDLGVLDEAGNVTLAGRIKELIIRGGENISPCEIENVIKQLPQTAACKVVGVPDAHFGEEICAVVVQNAEQALSADQVRRYVAAHLAYYKVPKYILFRPQLPHTPTGKIDGKAVGQLAREAIAAGKGEARPSAEA